MTGTARLLGEVVRARPGTLDLSAALPLHERRAAPPRRAHEGRFRGARVTHDRPMRAELRDEREHAYHARRLAGRLVR